MKTRPQAPTFPSLLSLLLALVVLAALAVLDLFGALPPAEAQIPRGSKFGKRWPQPYNAQLLRQYLTEGGFYHTVTVDSGGSGDFTKLSDAFAFVASQNPTMTSRWSILVYPGKAIDSFFSLTEPSNLTVPPYTSVQGVIAATGDGISVVSGQVWLKLTAPSGAALTLSAGSALVNLGLFYGGTTKAAVTVLSAPATSGNVDANVKNCVIEATPANGDAFPLELVSVSGGFVYARELHTFTFNGTLRRNIKVTGGALVLFDSRIYPGPSQPIAVEVTGGALLVYGGRINAGAAVEFARTGGTLQIKGFTYATESGTISHGTLRGDKLFVHAQQTPASASAPCAKGEWTADTSFIYVCVATNSWKRAALAAW
jgi:hypothetical protein